MTDGPRRAAAVYILDDYLTRTGLDRPADAAQQYQTELLRQWVTHLEAVLEAEYVPAPVADRIIRGVIWGSVPQQAEAGIRTAMADDTARLLEARGVPRW